MREPALIFDFGNVVAHFDYGRACARLGRPRGVSGATLLDRARAAGFTPLVQQYERGLIAAERFSAEFSARIGLDIPHAEFAAAWSDIFELNQSVARLLELLKRQGYTLVLGSNTNELHATQFRRQFAETLAHLDRLVLSFEVGHIKPAAEFYEACVQAAGAPAGSCVFIDDAIANVEGARAAGLQAVHYRDPDSLRAELRRLGVEWAER